jgi:hypothetical protein
VIGLKTSLCYIIYIKTLRTYCLLGKNIPISCFLLNCFSSRFEYPGANVSTILAIVHYFPSISFQSEGLLLYRSIDTRISCDINFDLQNPLRPEFEPIIWMYAIKTITNSRVCIPFHNSEFLFLSSISETWKPRWKIDDGLKISPMKLLEYYLL